MSAENTTILAGSIPAVERFISSWQSMLADPDLHKENIAKSIQPGLDIATNYYNKMGDTDAYIIAMFINPSIRFEWIRKNWSQEEQDEAKKVILLRAYVNVIGSPDLRSRTSSPGASGSGSDSRPPSRSRSRTRHWQVANRYRNAAQSLDFSGASGSATGGKQSIKDEMNHYMSSSLPPRKSTDMNHGKTTWPRIFRLFADYAPIQATSVLSKRVFSSSAETDTKR
ncbi:hypothetical protein FB451DRAFT_1165971 [Mycena latifolia]|nr:hypothetical protein FB451DRAFT_1165971 [Mycena latifolia]